MDATKHALVLTGEALPGFDANTVWPALASYFRMEPDRLRSDLLARAPITIKESEDLGKLRNLQDGASTIGAVTDLVAMGSEGNMFVLVNGRRRSSPIACAVVPGHRASASPKSAAPTGGPSSYQVRRLPHPTTTSRPRWPSAPSAVPICRRPNRLRQQQRPPPRPPCACRLQTLVPPLPRKPVRWPAVNCPKAASCMPDSGGDSRLTRLIHSSS